MKAADRELLSAVVVLRPAGRVELRAGHGRWVHAWFLKDLVRRRDPALAAVLHGDVAPTGRGIATRAAAWRQRLEAPDASAESSKQDKPFTLSTLQGGRPMPHGALEFVPERECWLRVTAFAPALAEWLAGVLRDTRGEVRIGRSTFEVLGAAVSPSELPPGLQEVAGPWIRREPVDRLIARACGAAGRQRSLHWQFLSPTTFRSGQRCLPFPLPSLMLARLAERWCRFLSDEGLAGNSARLGEYLQVEDFALRTEEAGLDGVPQGFVGHCAMRIGKGASPEIVRTIHVLSAFSFYAGVGSKTPMGLGQAFASCAPSSDGAGRRDPACSHHLDRNGR